MTAEMPDENSDSHEKLVWLDQICDRFEDAWGTDKQFSVEFVLQEISAERHDAVLKALLQLETELRVKTDNPVTADELALRFPDQPAIVETVLQNSVPADSLVPRDTVAPRKLPSEDVPPASSDGSTSGSLRIPRQLGRYRIIRKLGQGAMGSVFLAQDEQLDRQVAIKIPRGDVQRNKELRARFQREAQAAAALRHPFICPIYDIGEINGVHYICMAYIEGFSLSRYAIAESGLSEQRIAQLVLKLAEALAEAHEAGFIHRDLKPANVIVNENDEPVILDFGLARRIDPSEDTRVTQTGTTIGSPAYMSPEQVDGDQSKIGKHSDIYSLGVILYELLTGRIPFEGSMASVLGQIMMKDPEKPSEYRRDLSVRLENICQRMMAKDPNKRHPSMHAVVAALQEYLEKYSGDAAIATDSSSDESGTATSKSDRQKQRIESLIKGGDYAQAEKLLVALSQETDESQLEAATWAAAELPKLRKTREEVRAGRQEIYSTAARLVKSHDYEQAMRLLEEYPYDMRTPKMQDLLEKAEGKSHEVERLRKAIKAARSRGDNTTLLKLLQELLELKPADRKAKALYEQLTARSSGPISAMLGKNQPGFVKQMGSGLQWTAIFLVVIAAVSYPAYQWSKDYLPGSLDTGTDSDDVSVNFHETVPITPRSVSEATGPSPQPAAAQTDAGNSRDGQPGTGETPTWIELFNGRNLAGWKPIGFDGWKVEDGAIVGTSNRKKDKGWLMSEGEYSDYELELEYKLSHGSNSGIFLRAWETPDVSGRIFGEIQLLDSSAAEFRSVAAESSNGSYFGKVAPSPRPIAPPDQWNRVRISVVGQELQVWFNDTRVLNHTAQNLRAAGHIGFQLYPNQVKFRHVRVRIVTSDATTIRAGSPSGEIRSSKTDVLALLNPARDFIDKRLRLENGKLLTPHRDKKDARTALMMIPLNPVPEEYDLHLEIERKSDSGLGCNMGVVMGGRQAVIDMDGGSSPVRWSLARIDGYSMHDKQNPTVVNGKRFKRGEVTKVDIQVRTNSVRVLDNGSEVINWTGRPHQLSVWDKIQEKLTSPDQLFFFSQAEFVIHKMTLLYPISGALPNLNSSKSMTVINLLNYAGQEQGESRGVWKQLPNKAIQLDDAQVTFSTQLPNSYQLTTEFIRSRGSDSIAVGFPVGQSATQFVLDGYPLDGGRVFLTGPARERVATVEGMHVINGQQCRITVDVKLMREDYVKIRVSLSTSSDAEQRLLLRWEGNPTSLKPWKAIHPMSGVSVGVNKSVFLINRLDVVSH